MRAAAVMALLLAGCASSPGGNTLSFAQMQSLNPGVSGEWVLEEFPFASNVGLWPDGNVRSLRYPVTDPLGKRHSVTMEFDRAGVLCSKRYAGPMVRPPAPVPAPGTCPPK